MMERRMPASLKNQSVSLKPGVAELADALDSKTISGVLQTKGLFQKHAT